MRLSPIIFTVSPGPGLQPVDTFSEDTIFEHFSGGLAGVRVEADFDLLILLRIQVEDPRHEHLVQAREVAVELIEMDKLDEVIGYLVMQAISP